MDDYELIDTTEQLSAAMRERVGYNEIASAVGRMYGLLWDFIMRRGLRVVGPPFIYYHSWSDESADLECGFPVSEPFEGEGSIRPFTLPSLRAARGTHVGPYDRLVETYGSMERWIRSQGYEPADHMWEAYLNDPEKVPDEELMTEVIWPIK